MGSPSQFDWQWRKNYSNDAVSSCIRVSDEKVLFHPTYSSGTASVLGDTALSSPEHHYWEVEFTSPVYGTEIMVGLATKKLDLETHLHNFDSLLGLDKNSVGYSYHGYTKHNGVQKRYGEKWGKGDIIGVHIDTWRGNVYFYKNRNFQGLAYKGLQGMELFPIVTSTAAKSSIKLVTAFSFSNSLQFECFRKLSEKMSRSDLVNVYLPPGLRNFVLNNYWFLGRGSKTWMEPSPEKSTKVKKVILGKTKRNYKEDTSTSESEDDDEECFLNIRSKKLALMRKTRPSLSLQETSPVCTSQDFHYRRRQSQDDAKLLEGASACCEGNCKEANGDDSNDKEEYDEQKQSSPKISRKKFMLKIKPKSSD